jgi:hypothetical protein
LRDYAEGLGVSFKPVFRPAPSIADGSMKFFFCNVSEGWMAKVVRQACGLGGGRIETAVLSQSDLQVAVAVTIEFDLPGDCAC